MNEKKHRKKLLLAVIPACAVAVSLIFLGGIVLSNVVVTNSKPDTRGWVLKNAQYEVVPNIGENVTFIVTDKNGKTVYKSDGVGWRAWDFKKIELCKDNSIIIETGDMGKQIIEYSNGSWSLKQTLL